MLNIFIARFIPIFIGVSGAFCVLFGAWLAHAGVNLSAELNSRLTTAHHYQVIHTLALLAVYVLIQFKPRKTLYLSAGLLVLGILLFSGTLYLKTLLMMPVIGKLTPMGGVTLALAWLSLVYTGVVVKR
ncbi:DUF423 domain-containing protein [Colwellia sp. MEBiC06753]